MYNSYSHAKRKHWSGFSQNAVYVHSRKHTHTHTHNHIYPNSYNTIHTHTCTVIAFPNSHKHVHIDTCTHTHNTNVPTQIHTHTHIHVYTHTATHTQPHTHKDTHRWHTGDCYSYGSNYRVWQAPLATCGSIHKALLRIFSPIFKIWYIFSQQHIYVQHGFFYVHMNRIDSYKPLYFLPTLLPLFLKTHTHTHTHTCNS